ncbi:MAG: hypothetical protein V4507_11880, partial [Verrucomicrobiota bacterium]
RRFSLIDALRGFTKKTVDAFLSLSSLVGAWPSRVLDWSGASSRAWGMGTGESKKNNNGGIHE